MRAWHEREPFAFNGRYTKLRYVNIWPRPIQQPHPPIHIPGGGSIETFDFCIDNTYSYSYLSFGGYLRGQGADGRLLGSRGRAQRPDNSPYRAGSRKPSAWPTPTPRPSGSMRKHVSYFYNRCLHVYPGFADAPGYRTIKTIQKGILSQYAPLASFKNLTWKDLVEGGQRHRGQSRNRAPAHGGPDQEACMWATSSACCTSATCPKRSACIRRDCSPTR